MGRGKADIEELKGEYLGEFVIKGRRFKAYRYMAGIKDVPYVLVGRRGAWYALMRSRAKPWYLFVINYRTAGFNLPSYLAGVWFTDKDGELHLVSGG